MKPIRRPMGTKSSMRTRIAVGAAVALAACSDALAPITVGEPYLLRTINGAPIPWTTPVVDSAYLPTTITEGWITILDDSVAERHERFGRWVVGPLGDSIPLLAEWTRTASYRRGSATIVLSYHVFDLGPLGPSRLTETLHVTRGGGLMLRQTGLVPPIDSIIRMYCTTPRC
jgi:hypothetical protein